MLSVLCCMLFIRHESRSTWGWKVSFGMQITLHHWGKSDQEPGGQNWSQDRGGMLFTGLPPGSHSATLLTLPRTTWAGTALPTETWVLWHQLTIKKMPHRHAHMPIGWLFSPPNQHSSSNPGEKKRGHRKLCQLLVIIWALRSNLVVLSGTKYI